MSGIVGYLGKEQAYPILIENLKELESYGYDRAGIALLNETSLNIYKKKGNIKGLMALCKNEDQTGNAGIGYTRWATYSEVNQVSAHPQTTKFGSIALVYRGVMENYRALKVELQVKGYRFVGESGSEVLIHLIEDIYQRGEYPLEEAVCLAIQKIKGTFSMVVMSKRSPRKMIAVKRGNTLAVGKKEDGFYINSCSSALLKHTKEVVNLKDDEIVTATLDGKMSIKTLDNDSVMPEFIEFPDNSQKMKKSEYEYHMLKELYDQTDEVMNYLKDKLDQGGLPLDLRSIKKYNSFLKTARSIISYNVSVLRGFNFDVRAGKPYQAA